MSAGVAGAQWGYVSHALRGLAGTRQSNQTVGDRQVIGEALGRPRRHRVAAIYGDHRDALDLVLAHQILAAARSVVLHAERDRRRRRSACASAP
ncbi:MAG: hypothetical protein MZW92_46835 [Comamonadaceae bacterium]|nr:hypothetical protein [Comamonadaceae bacterium]